MIDRKEIYQIAQLSKLSISDAEIFALTKDIARMLAFADQISFATGCLLSASCSDDVFSLPLTLNTLREDQPFPSLSQKLALQNVQGGENGLFVIGRKLL